MNMIGPSKNAYLTSLLKLKMGLVYILPLVFVVQNESYRATSDVDCLARIYSQLRNIVDSAHRRNAAHRAPPNFVRDAMF